MLFISRALLPAIIFPFIVSCAVVSKPQGGKQDVAPPKVLIAEPANLATSFNSKKISIRFDEFFQLKDQQNQLIISPPMDPEPEFVVSGKTLNIIIQDTLAPNTTYTINFGKAVVDVHESNAYDNLKYVFSTGTYVDSLTYAGTVLNAADRSPVKGIFVMLYKGTDDSIPIRSKPDYFTRADDSGNFKLDHLAPGTYKILALKDQNANYLFDQPNENVAFSNSRIEAGDSIKASLFLFIEEAPKQVLMRTTPLRFGVLTMAFKKPVHQLQITNLDNGKTVNGFARVLYNPTRDTVTFWMKYDKPDTLHWVVREQEVNDTISVTMKARIAKNRLRTIEAKAALGLPVNSFHQNDTVYLFALNPIDSLSLSHIKFIKDSVPAPVPQFFFTDSTREVIGFTAALKEKSKYRLALYPGAVTDILGLTNDTTLFDFSVKEESDYGNLVLTLKLPEASNNLVLQLIDEKGMAVRRIDHARSGVQKFTYLLPGRYKIKVFNDLDGNGRWSTGNYLQHLQPEPVYFSKELITIRANWDSEAEFGL